LWERFARGIGGVGGGVLMVVLLSREVVGSVVVFLLRMLSFRSRLVVASGKLGGMREL
jgi:hypothetical protein